MSVAFEAQGETVPKRGRDDDEGAGAAGAPGFAVGQQRFQPLPFGGIGGVIGGHQVHEPRRDTCDLVVDGLEPGKQLLDAKFAEGRCRPRTR